MNKKIIIRTVSLAVMAILIISLFIGNIFAIKYFDLISEALSGPTGSFENEELKESLKASDTLNRKLEEEGIVLLKNEKVDGNNTLPLTKDEIKKVNVLGWSSTGWAGETQEDCIEGGWVTGSDGSVNASSGANKTRAKKLYNALTEAGIEYNTEISDMYYAFRNKRSSVRALHDNTPTRNYFMLIEPTRDAYNATGKDGNTILQNAKNFSDVALVVISRLGGESADLPFFQPKNTTGQYADTATLPCDRSRTYLDISTEEEAVLQMAKENFKKVIVIVNNCNNMCLDYLDDYDIDAAISVGGTGQSGVYAIPKILSGEVTPSGKTTATQPYELADDPTFTNSGSKGAGQSCVTYAEDIYIGYRWYETADAEGFWNNRTKTIPSRNGGETILTGYDAVVQYPFGHGLSYTEFDWEVVDVTPSADEVINQDTEVTVKVRVTNVGSMPGKDVVELYCSQPYYEGGIEKSSVILVAFAKTGELLPANMTTGGNPEAEVVELKFSAYELASYDCYDRNFNRFVGYELEAGDYAIKLMNNAHELNDCDEAEWNYKVESNIKFRNDPTTGNQVTNRFTNYDVIQKNTETNTFDKINVKAYANNAIDGSDADQQDTIYLSRENFADTFPTQTIIPKTGTAVNNAKTYVGEIETVDMMPTTGQDNGLLLVKGENGEKLTSSQLNGSTKWKVNNELVQELGKNYDSEKWDLLLNQMTMEDMKILIERGGYHTHGIESVGKPNLLDSDGPSGLNRHTIYVGAVDRSNWTMYVMPNVMAQTWNLYLVYSFGLSISAEAVNSGNSGWYAPGANMQRSFFGGRCSEYYSEDGLLSGLMAGQACKGAIANGMYVYLKHFAVNENETNRHGLATYLTEQSLREIYLKAFEVAVKTGKANGIMTSLNRLGSTWTGGNRALCNDILREEWGFRGAVITDSYTGSYMPLNQGLIGGNDLYLSTSNETGTHFDNTDPTMVMVARTACKNIMYSWCNAYYVSQNHDASADEFVTVKGEFQQADKPMAYWFIGVVALDVVVLGGSAVLSYLLLRKKNKEKT